MAVCVAALAAHTGSCALARDSRTARATVQRPVRVGSSRGAMKAADEATDAALVSRTQRAFREALALLVG